MGESESEDGYGDDVQRTATKHAVKTTSTGCIASSRRAVNQLIRPNLGPRYGKRLHLPECRYGLFVAGIIPFVRAASSMRVER